MVTNAQYPHALQIKDESGEWIAISICRDRPNDKGKMISVGDKVNYQFASLIYAPSELQRLLVGQDIRVIGSRAERRLEADVKRFSVDDFHCRIWV